MSRPRPTKKVTVGANTKKARAEFTAFLHPLTDVGPKVKVDAKTKPARSKFRALYGSMTGRRPRSPSVPATAPPRPSGPSSRH